MSSLDLADGLRLLYTIDAEGYFGHTQHLRFAWVVLDEATEPEEAEHAACLTIRHIAELGGNPAKYHATVTIFWIRILDHLRRQHPEIASLDELLAVCPELGNSRLPETYWSDLENPACRTGWVEPDIRPLP